MELTHTCIIPPASALVFVVQEKCRSRQNVIRKQNEMNSGSCTVQPNVVCVKTQASRIQVHPRRPRDSQAGREKGRDESFQVRAKEPLGTDSYRAISKNSSGCRLLIGHKKCFVLLCPIGEQFLLSSFREFVHDGYCFDHGLSGSCIHQRNASSQETFSLISNPHKILQERKTGILKKV